MEKDFRYVELFELYGSLLTERQRETFSSHYLYDLSLSEIAEPSGSTRQSVYAAVKKVKEKLDEYEDELKLFEKTLKLKALAEKLMQTDKASAQNILEIIGR